MGKAITLSRAQIVMRAKQSHPDNGTGRLIAAGKVMIQVYCKMEGRTMTVVAQPGVTHRAGYLTAGDPITLAHGVAVDDKNNRAVRAKRLCSSMLQTDVQVQWIKA